MEHEMKMPPRWDFEDPDCSVDLKLGGLVGFAGFGERREPRIVAGGVAMMSTAEGILAKRVREVTEGGPSVFCSVDNCKFDLKNCREYHRRHKVCEAHSKTPVVLIGGQERRFCQQCSRFHSLIEFDEAKRSCRKRLNSHNIRRRKPPPESINPYFNHQGSRFSSYHQIAAQVTNLSPIYTQNQLLHTLNRQETLLPSSSGYKAAKRFPFLDESQFDASITCLPPLHKSFVHSESSGTRLFFSNNVDQVLDSKCALSLLSLPTQASRIDSNPIVSPYAALTGQSLLPSLRFRELEPHSDSTATNNIPSTGFSFSAMDDVHAGNIFVSDSHHPPLHCSSLFHLGVEGSSDEALHALPFPWQ